ncbi:hypothetical protein QBC34DRAFT_179845 [Podospora aff. communis PSN243]|uniref:Transporter n=1 Tax=Podospora aff. communis PSN243 TaxID=3040156 RepID=A0AAV9GA35_9PEZI|nr:hypothetical protein QBC34DRAFT_179845 [Podospora aff. communis PSN243]
MHQNHTQPVIQLSTEPPDIYGFSQVSGLYGPGTWSAWYLCVAGSWLGLFLEDLGFNKTGLLRKLDLNLIAYLVALNWVAIDLIRHSLTLRHLYSENPHPDLEVDEQHWMRETASVGAALTVVIWGALHGQSQLFIALTKQDRRRERVLFAGLWLPWASVLNAATCLGLWGAWMCPFTGHCGSLSYIPAFYFPEDAPALTEIRMVLWVALLWTGVASLAFPAVLVIGRYVPRVMIRSEAYRAGPSGLIRRALMAVGAAVELSAVPLLAGCVLAWSFFYFFLAISSASYIAWGYVFGSRHSESCFFMPCAPQVLSETDQAGALFAGIVLLVGVDIVLPLYQTVKRRYRDDQEFRETTNRRMAMGLRRQLGGGNAANVEEGATASRAEGLAEQGFAMDQLGRSETDNATGGQNHQES